MLRNMNHTSSMTRAETIGERIKRERRAVGMTQRDLAHRVQVGVPHISKVEAGRESPSDELLHRIAEVFDLDPDELMLVAGRVPDDVVEDLAADPVRALEFLRTFQGKSSEGKPHHRKRG